MSSLICISNSCVPAAVVLQNLIPVIQTMDKNIEGLEGVGREGEGRGGH